MASYAVILSLVLTKTFRKKMGNCRHEQYMFLGFLYDRGLLHKTALKAEHHEFALFS